VVKKGGSARSTETFCASHGYQTPANVTGRDEPATQFPKYTSHTANQLLKRGTLLEETKYRRWSMNQEQSQASQFLDNRLK
jgi:hypothetical protein